MPPPPAVEVTPEDTGDFVPVQDMTSMSQGKHRQTQTGSILPTGLASGTLQVLWNKYSLTPFTAASHLPGTLGPPAVRGMSHNKV